MNKPTLEQQKIIDQNLRILESLERKYGAEWVKKTYENAPMTGRNHYELAVKMNAIYHYRKNGKTGDIESLVEILTENTKDGSTQNLKTTTPFYSSYNLSPQLKASLSGFNSSKGKKTKSPQEYFNKWIDFKIRKKQEKAKKLIEEANTKKEEVLRLIDTFFKNREKKTKNFTLHKNQESVIEKEFLENSIKQKKENKLPEPKSEKMLESSKDLDIYYISTNMSTYNNGHIRVFKNGKLLVEKDVIMTTHEAEYRALILALLVVDKKSIIYSNSQVVVYTATNYYKLNAANLKPSYDATRQLINEKKVDILWISSDKTNIKEKESPLSKKAKLNEKLIDFSKITLSTEQSKLFEYLQTTKNPVFITGRAGTGKSLLLQYYRQNTKKNVVICAFTGIAALNVGGQTIHSLFKIPPGFVPRNNLRLEKRTEKLLKHIDVIVIDEVSMVGPDLIDAIDHLLKQAKKRDIPFGGAQVIMFGDMYQLPPVQSDKSLQEYFEATYGGQYFFNAGVWKNTPFEIKDLTTIFRQKDEDFKSILNAIREGRVTDDQLAILNKRADIATPMKGVLTLATINRTVDKINEERLAHLEGNIYEYKAEVTGNFDKKSFPTDEILRLKKGAQVMLLKNDKEKRWVNGTLGYIHALTTKEILVSIDGVVHSVPREKWDKSAYTYNEKTNTLDQDIVSSFTQFPIKLAWAITVHKAQGQTYTNIELDMGFGSFAHGQTYVALSRCKSLEGLYLKRKIRKSDIIVDQKIIEFMKRR